MSMVLVLLMVKILESVFGLLQVQLHDEASSNPTFKINDLALIGTCFHHLCILSFKRNDFWILLDKNSSGSPDRVYCKMDANCTGYTGGWMRVGYIDMRNSSHQCPRGLTLITQRGMHLVHPNY